MNIEDAYWTPTVNMLLIRCQCGKLFEHPANRKVALCPQCGLTKNTLIMKREVPDA